MLQYMPWNVLLGIKTTGPDFKELASNLPRSQSDCASVGCAGQTVLIHADPT